MSIQIRSVGGPSVVAEVGRRDWANVVGGGVLYLL